MSSAWKNRKSPLTMAVAKGQKKNISRLYFNMVGREKSMVNQTFGVCTDCKNQKKCVAGSRGVQCSQYSSIRQERKERYEKYQQEILANLRNGKV